MTVKKEDTPPALMDVLTDEGLRLFFPLAAIYVALWPVLWVVVLGFDLPLARTVPATLWHPHEMMIGGFGAALIGFLTTAVPEFTQSRGLAPHFLLVLCAIWITGRLIGVLGFDAFGAVGAIADIGWIGGLLAYLLAVGWAKRTTKLVGFTAWMAILLAAETATRWSFIAGDMALAGMGVRVIGLAYLGLLGLALSRIYVRIINVVLDPSEETSPYRPHPGRQSLASGLTVLVVLGEVLTMSPAVQGYLAIAAGAAFIDRAGEAFIGKQFFRSEILALFASPFVAGLGLLLLGASRLGAPLTEAIGWHVALMGGLGLGIMAVLSIAGLLHTRQVLRFPIGAKIALALIIAAVVLRVWGDIFSRLPLPLDPLALSAIAWALAFGAWLHAYWPLLRDPGTIGQHNC